MQKHGSLFSLAALFLSAAAFSTPSLASVDQAENKTDSVIVDKDTAVTKDMTTQDMNSATPDGIHSDNVATDSKMDKKDNDDAKDEENTKNDASKDTLSTAGKDTTHHDMMHDLDKSMASEQNNAVKSL
ncbi:MAG: hypothetical protein H2057_02385 [Alphaproteobacteria bacterium]|nr:hypothetical protein [Alphaproteobacteria bacterium]